MKNVVPLGWIALPLHKKQSRYSRISQCYSCGQSEVKIILTALMYLSAGQRYHSIRNSPVILASLNVTLVARLDSPDVPLGWIVISFHQKQSHYSRISPCYSCGQSEVKIILLGTKLPPGWIRHTNKDALHNLMVLAQQQQQQLSSLNPVMHYVSHRIASPPSTTRIADSEWCRFRYHPHNEHKYA